MDGDHIRMQFGDSEGWIGICRYRSGYLMSGFLQADPYRHLPGMPEFAQSGLQSPLL
jgi:hypothetical protein